MIELYQAEWCPYSHRVRRRLTELGLDFVARQVSPDRAEREAMERTTGSRSIPTLVDDGRVFAEVDEILAHLDTTYPEPAEAAGHREKDAEEGPAWRDPSRAAADGVARLVVGFDGSAGARRALERAARLAVAERAAVVVVAPTGEAAAAAALLDEQGAEAKLVEGPREPAEVAREVDADLLVGGPEAVADAPCDVLVVR